MVKAAIKREQSDACISYAEREQVRCETSKVKNGQRSKVKGQWSKVNGQRSTVKGQLEKVLKSCSPCKKNKI